MKLLITFINLVFLTSNDTYDNPSTTEKDNIVKDSKKTESNFKNTTKNAKKVTFGPTTVKYTNN